jgi:hypothetical protein
MLREAWLVFTPMFPTREYAGQPWLNKFGAISLSSRLKFVPSPAPPSRDDVDLACVINANSPILKRRGAVPTSHRLFDIAG